MPLLRQNILLGSLNLGSYQATRFTANMATDFIERLALIIAICLENVINRERLTYIGLTDALTNVSNRRFVEQRLIEEVGRARRQKYSIACLYLDIDFFKAINDKHGHQGGDDVLKEVASRIKSELRLSDTLGRFGGEEFVVLLVNANEQDALHVAERIRLSIASQPFSLTMADSCSTSISIGLATLNVNQHKENINVCVEELLWRADKALYEAKRSGRNRVCTAP
jgi:diguanylate cyclase (GGDEF)-like protein